MTAWQVKGWQHKQSHHRSGSVLFTLLNHLRGSQAHFQFKAGEKKAVSNGGNVQGRSVFVLGYFCVHLWTQPPLLQSWRCALTHCLLFRGLGDKKVLTATIVRRDFLLAIICNVVTVPCCEENTKKKKTLVLQYRCLICSYPNNLSVLGHIPTGYHWDETTLQPLVSWV